MVCGLGLLAAGSYYLGRSHDNNLLNLMPFMVLLACCIFRHGSSQILRGFAAMVTVGIVAWLSTFGLGSMQAAYQDGWRGRFGISDTLADMRLETDRGVRRLDRWLTETGQSATSEDARRALNWLRDRQSGPIAFLTQPHLVARGTPGPMWSGMLSSASWGLLPAAEIEALIARGCHKLNRSGWVLVDGNVGIQQLSHFLKVYNVADTQRFGALTAYQLVPRCCVAC
jgi:hypothetical protein